MARRLKHRPWSPFKRRLPQRPALSFSFISTLAPLHRLHCFRIQHYTTRMPSFIFQVATAAIALATMAPAATAAPIDITMLNKAHIVQASDVSTHAYPASNVDVRHYHNLYPVMRTLSRDEYYLSTVSLLLSNEYLGTDVGSYFLPTRCNAISTISQVWSRFRRQQVNRPVCRGPASNI